MMRLYKFILLLFSLCIAGCVLSKQTVHVPLNAEKPFAYPGLNQIVAFDSRVFSGSKPVGRLGMKTLRSMGVDTIICVDGVAPDVNNATLFNINTIHIPLKYISPSKEQVLDLATALNTGQQNGKVYIHCHHGKHRSAAAAAVALLALGQSDVKSMTAKMRISQTSSHYKGLWDAVNNQTKIDPLSILANNKKMPAAVKPEGITLQMIAIDEAMDRLQLLQRNNWTTPKTHPDLAPASDAGLISEVLRQMQLSDDINQFALDYETKMINALHHANSLEEAVNENLSTHELNQFMNRLEQSCINCHDAFRQ